MTITELNRKQTAYKNKLKKIEQFVNSFQYVDETKDYIELTSKLNSINDILKELDNLQNEYCSLPDKVELNNSLEILSDMEEDAEKFKVSILVFLSKYEEQKTENAKLSPKSHIKLPDLPLPTFSGKFQEFENFKTQFMSVIGNNDSLNESQKLMYLRSALKNEAALIQSDQDNFDSLLKALENRYENERALVDIHIAGILSINKLHNENPSQIRSLIDTVRNHMRSLKNLKLESNSLSDAIILHVLNNKIDKESQRLFQLSLTTTQVPSLQDFLSFLEVRCIQLESVIKSDFAEKSIPIKNKSSSGVNNSPWKSFLTKDKNKTSTAVESNPNQGQKACAICNQFKKHSVYNCEMFLNHSPLERYELCKKHNICTNCLNFHPSKSCTSKSRCQICSSFHNTKLHRDKTDVSIPSTAEAFIDTAPKVNSEQCFALRSTDKKNSKPMKYLMSTAVAYVNGMPVRIILDSASETNFISSDCAITLGLKRNRIHSSVSGINGLAQDIKYETNATISNKDNSFNESLKFMVVPKISSVTPSCNLDISKLSLPKHIKLADPSFHKPAKISMLLGAQVFFKIIKADQIKINDSITLQNSVFNYIVTGGLPTADDKLYFFLLSEQEGLENLISKFWQLESLEDESLNLNSQTKLCEDHFVNNHRRDQTGHYIVQMAFLKEPSCLGESKQTAIRRLNSLWRKLEANPNLQQLYRNFIHEYLDMGHMEQVFEVSEPTVAYYMPHHGVLRPDSKSTPLRTVFDASCATSTGESLNSILANGGVIQDELFAILLRFRKNRIGLISDIKKMFRMIFIDESQRDLLRIVWKESIDDPIKTYKMNRVVYGTTCAPYLAKRVLKQLAMDDGHNYPLAASAVSSDMYMDDLLTGAADIYSAKQLKEQLIALFRGGGMQLHKWSSNCKELLANSEVSDGDVSLTIPDETKALGLLWRPQKDSLAFSVSANVDTCESSKITKRSVLSTTARIFDPLGLISPVVTKAKLLMQELWRLKLDWNDSLPIQLESQWKRFVMFLSTINTLNIPRYIFLDYALKIELHGFADASEKAYGAAIYVRCLSNSGEISTNLLCSKSRIAPLKSVTIPRLELCAAVLLAKLAQKTITSMKISFHSTVLWTDSTIVLAWIQKDPSVLKPFVRNRVSAIQNITEVSAWQHVPSKENPADIISRGIDPEKIQDCNLWWFGPSFLQDHSVVSPCVCSDINDNELYQREFKKTPTDPVCLVVQGQEVLPIINNCSSFTRLQRVIGWCVRFVRNAKNSLQPSKGNLTSPELFKSLMCLVKNVQANCFAQEIQCLKRGQQLPNSSSLINLSPFSDEQDILRVGGRLKNSNLPIERKHPILLPYNNHFSDLIINHFHVLYLHTGAEATLANIRTKFWLINGRNYVRKIIRKCVPCLKVDLKNRINVIYAYSFVLL
ncbi:hypothetical protein AVEN_221435-1 [Araneus ventricosus]|uniref:Integrase zinc-binding domain-containing protein n=2 Tax=Araneus ventricosus TaxID=182803 RepID=A0A4Y2HQJ9_ARAVE|nr:hypothetical protein AVEN_168004-1 [Araneus ventricosus]GBM67659.1 hypothetical protein AVEN_186712-1 [Araneus ventricosus]GBM92846.1 hypothetical protein AVEN_221435-1 [Araneus ventricosus]